MREIYLHSDVDGVHDQVGALWGPGGQNTSTWTTQGSIHVAHRIMDTL